MTLFSLNSLLALSFFILSWLPFLVSAVGLLCFFLLVLLGDGMTGWSRRAKNASNSVRTLRLSLLAWLSSKLGVIPEWGRRFGLGIALAALALVAALPSGYFYGYHAGFSRGQWELLHDRFIYSDVLIVEKYNDQQYRLQPARMRPFEVKTCEPVDWERGQMMTVFTYQQRKGCKDVSLRGSYQFYSYQGRRLTFRTEVNSDD